MRLKKYQFSVIYWHDASLSYRKSLPKAPLYIDMTLGVIVSKTKEFINIGMNCQYDRKTQELKVIDGMVIPRGSILKIQSLGYLR